MKDKNKDALIVVTTAVCAIMGVLLVLGGWDYSMKIGREGEAILITLLRPVLICGGLLMFPMALLFGMHRVIFASKAADKQVNLP